MRGALTDEVKKEMIKWGFDGTERELRLMPYIMCCLLDNTNIDPRRVNEDERRILISWKEKGWLSGISVDFAVSSYFEKAIHEILKIGYMSDVIYEEDK